MPRWTSRQEAHPGVGGGGAPVAGSMAWRIQKTWLETSVDAAVTQVEVEAAGHRQGVVMVMARRRFW